VTGNVKIAAELANDCGRLKTFNVAILSTCVCNSGEFFSSEVAKCVINVRDFTLLEASNFAITSVASSGENPKRCMPVSTFKKISIGSTNETSINISS